MSLSSDRLNRLDASRYIGHIPSPTARPRGNRPLVAPLRGTWRACTTLVGLVNVLVVHQESLKGRVRSSQTGRAGQRVIGGLDSRAVRPLIAFWALVAAVLTLLAAGCGKSSDTKASEAYADSVCSAAGTWKQQIQSIGTSLSSGGFTKDSLQAALTKAESATKTMVTQIKAVPPPNTSEGKAAKQQLDQLTTDVNSTVEAAKSAATQLEGNASASSIATAVAALAPQVKSLANEAQSAFETLKNAGGSLGSAFKNTDSCKNLG